MSAPGDEGVPPQGEHYVRWCGRTSPRAMLCPSGCVVESDGVNRVFIGDTLIDEYDSPDWDWDHAMWCW